MQVVFVPLVSWVILVTLGVGAAGLVALAVWRGGLAWGLRALALGAGILALSGPHLQRRQSEALGDVVLVLRDQSASARLGARPGQARAAADDLHERLVDQGISDIRDVIVGDAPGDQGTALLAAAHDALADIPVDQLAGVFILSDGIAHDVDLGLRVPAPIHLLRLGAPAEWDRRLTVPRVPAFGLVGEDLPITLRVSDHGAAPEATSAEVLLSFDGGDPYRFRVPLGEETQLPVPLPHGGVNVLRITTPDSPGELSARNNTAVLEVNGIRDRLRVMLINGAPYAGERAWRNLLKSDGNVDLVHFTILRSADNLDTVPVEELSLIAFPTDDLFLNKLDEFDLVIFDSYPLRGMVEPAHLESIRRYAERGGAVLVAAGPEFAGAQSLARSPLGPILPARPTARVLDQAYRPHVTDLGQRHPITRTLAPEGDPTWGAWLRLVDVSVSSGDVLLRGAQDLPLLIIDQVGEGRVGLLASDQAWLWARGYDGGGPHRELLRRLAHWLMKEPELEEEQLSLSAGADGVQITYTQRDGTPPPVMLRHPDGTRTDIELTETGPGQFSARIDQPQPGLYSAHVGDLSAVAQLGAVLEHEYAQLVDEARALTPIVTRDWTLADGMPRIRAIQGGRPYGPGWLGITPRAAARVTSVQSAPLLPVGAWLALVAGLAVLAWLWEGRRRA